jgi:hypothetical protein
MLKEIIAALESHEMQRSARGTDKDGAVKFNLRWPWNFQACAENLWEIWKVKLEIIIITMFIIKHQYQLSRAFSVCLA